MSEPTGLDERLRAALGACRAREAGGLRPGPELDAARARLLSGIRRRRVRRLQVVGVAAVVVLGLAVGLSQVLGSAARVGPALASPAPSSGSALASPVPSSGSAPAHRPSAHRTATTAPVPSLLPRLVAICHVRGRTLDGCGTVAAVGASSHDAAFAGVAGSEASGTAALPARLGAPIVVRAGTRVVIDLPTVTRARRWSTPSVAGAPGHRGSAPPALVRPVRSPGAAQQFVVATEAPATVVLESEDDVFAGEGAVPAPAAGPTDVWALELKVEGT